MEKSGQIYTLGIWSVKPGNEVAFIEAWKTFAEWTVRHQPGAIGAFLLQDITNPQRLISSGPWKDAESIQAWRGMPEFKEFITRARDLCEDIQPYTLKLVAEVAASKQ